MGQNENNSGKSATAMRRGVSPPSGGGRSQGGGLAGRSDGTISNSFATGSVGCITTMPTPTCADQAFGGLVGGDSATISDSYWDTTTGLDDGCGSGTTPATCNGAATGLTTTDMKDGSSAALGDGFQLTDGEYPKVYQCTTCTGTLEYSDELVPGQDR